MENQLDPQVVNLAKAIRKQESNDNFTARSKDGSFGAYQFIKPTWDATAKKYGVNAQWDKATPAQQNEVAYKQIKEWKDKGYNVGQVASMWNAGAGRPDAYKTGLSGTNKDGVNYNVSEYAKKVATNYQAFKGQSVEQPVQQAPVQQVEQPKKNFLEKTGDVLDTIFGGKKIGEAIGTQIAKARATDQEKQYITGPSVEEVAADVGRVALNFAPVGKIAGGLTRGAKALPLLGKIARPVGNIATGALLGGTGQALSNISEGEKATFGTGAGIGAGLAAIPYAGKALGALGREALGASTGTGAGTIQEFTSAIAKGGEPARIAREAMRGNLNPQDIVEEAKSAFGQVIKNRSDEYTSKLNTLKTKSNVIDHKPIIERFNKQLDEFGVFFDDAGKPDFSRAPGLGRYEGDLEKMSKTLSRWGTKEGDNTIAGIDNLKQVIDDFRIGSADSKKFDSFVTSLRGEAKDIIKKDLIKSKDLKTLNTYEKMLKDYESSTKEIRDIQKSLSLGDKASIDTAFRKLSTVLRTNNEVRKIAVDQLNEITGGTLLPKIAGQQLSETLPRGLMRTVVTGGVGVGTLSGAGIIPMLKLALFSSPRAVGEILNAMGIVGNKANIVKNALIKSGVTSPGDYLFSSKTPTMTKQGIQAIQ